MTGSTGVVLVTLTAPEEQLAFDIASLLVEEGLAACAQVSMPIRSTFRWKGEVERTEEWVVVAKTAAERAGAVLDRVRSMHPYEVPELVVTDVVGGDPEYLAWVIEESTPR